MDSTSGAKRTRKGAILFDVDAWLQYGHDQSSNSHVINQYSMTKKLNANKKILSNMNLNIINWIIIER